MSYKPDRSELENIIHVIKDNENNVHWPYFVVSAQRIILNSYKPDSTPERLRRYWFRLISELVNQLGYNFRSNNDNWYIIERALAAPTTTTASTPIPVPNAMPPPPSPALQSPIALDSDSIIFSNSSNFSSRSRSKSSLGTPLTESRKDDALLLYKDMDDENKWRLTSGRFVEDVMCEFVQTLNFEQ